MTSIAPYHAPSSHDSTQTVVNSVETLSSRMYQVLSPVDRVYYVIRPKRFVTINNEVCQKPRAFISRDKEGAITSISVVFRHPVELPRHTGSKLVKQLDSSRND